MRPFREFKNNLRSLFKLDFLLIIITLAISFFGIYNIYLSTRLNYGNHYYRMQLIFLALGVFGALLVLLLGYQRIMPFVTIFYWLVNILLILVLTQQAIGGASGWFRLGPISIQPAELAKLSVLFMVSSQMDKYKGRINDIKVFMIISLYALIPMVLMMLQPEMGITMVCFFIVLSIYFVMGLKLRVILIGFILLISSVVGALNTSLVPDHWKQRIYSFMSGVTDELNVDYQLSTAKISIGSGQVLGSENPGYYNWIPENYTDFIFAVISENFGFIGSALLIFAYMLLLYRVLKISRKTKNIFGKSVATGVFAIILFSILQNMGMTMGLMPIAGITLPFVSYGGSSLLTNMAAIAMVLSIGMRRERIMF